MEGVGKFYTPSGKGEEIKTLIGCKLFTLYWAYRVNILYFFLILKVTYKVVCIYATPLSSGQNKHRELKRKKKKLCRIKQTVSVS